MDEILAAIVADDRKAVRALLKADSSLASDVVHVERLYQESIFHWFYVGDTALHLAAAGYRVEIAKLLLVAGSDPNASANRRRSTPLHYSADGIIAGPCWDPKKQVETIQCLIEAGANVNAQDKNGATPLHRAVRTRCAAAVECLLRAGGDPMRWNKPGSTPFHLAVQNTGRGGSGEEKAKLAQRQIVETFLALGMSPDLKNGEGKSVRDCAEFGIRDLLAEHRQ